MGIVAAVQQKGRLAAQQLKPARPAHLRQSLPDGAVGHLPAAAPQGPQRLDGDGRVAGLVAGQQGQSQPRKAVVVEGLAVQTGGAEGQFGKVRHREGGVLGRGRRRDDPVGLGRAAVADHRAARLDDARLGGGDVGQGGAQFLDVVHPQRGDDRALGRVDDVGGVQRAAQPHLQHHDIAVLLREIEHPQRGDQLKLGGDVGHGRGGGPHLLHQADQVPVRDGRAVDLDALIEADDIGRSEQPDLIPGTAQAAVQHGGGAALAVGAGHMDKAELFVGVPQGGQQGAGPRKARLVALPVDRVDVGEGFLIGHHGRLPSRPPRAAAIRAWLASRARTRTNSAPARTRALGMRAASTAQG